jgi:REP element-mobilizing transposase RayT
MKSRQQDFRFRAHGGARRGAGRKPKGEKAGVAHRPRSFGAKHPLHVTVKVKKDLPFLRRRWIWKLLQWSFAITSQRHDFRACQASLQGNHLHFMVEADTREALARGMQGLLISIAKQLNRRISRKGAVFADRYHSRELKTPLEVKHALNYILNNWRHHANGPGKLDEYSSGPSFGGWKGEAKVLRLGRYELISVVRPRTWLLEKGWLKHGELSPYARPGPEAES